MTGTQRTLRVPNYTRNFVVRRPYVGHETVVEMLDICGQVISTLVLGVGFRLERPVDLPPSACEVRVRGDGWETVAFEGSL